MRYVCPKDGKKRLLQRARTVHWKKWAAKHEYEELKEGIWLEPALALLRRKRNEEWTEKHRNVARHFLWKEAGCRKDSSTLVGRIKGSAKPAIRRKAQKSTGSTTVQNGTTSDGRFQRLSESGSKKERTSKEEWKWQSGLVAHPLSGGQWKRCHVSVKKWESEKDKS